MTNICHSTSSSTNISISLRSLLLFCIALLLVGGKVHCANLGLGKHTVDIANGKVTKIKEDWSIIKPGEDLTGLKQVQDACDGVTFEGEQIKVWYNKSSKAAENGCKLDLLVTKDLNKFTLDVGASHSESLKRCLRANGFPNENLLPFAYSLGDGEFEYMRKNGPKKSSEGCAYKDHCKKFNSKDIRHGDICMKVADWMVGFEGHKDGSVTNHLKQIDEPAGWWCRSKTKSSKNDLFFQIDIDIAEKTKWTVNKDHFEGCDHEMNYGNKNREAYCYTLFEHVNTLRKVGRWEITDPSFAGRLKGMNYYNHIITFYVLPQKSARQQSAPGEKFWHEVKREPLNGPNCDMYIRFPNTYKLLGPVAVATKPDEGNTSSTESSSTTSTTITTPAPTSGSNLVLIIVIVVVVLVLALLVGVLVWFFVLRKTSEEDLVYPGVTTVGGMTTKTKTMAGTTVGATQAKTAGMTTVGTVGGTQAKGGTTMGGATSTKGGATSTKGGATSKAGATTKGGATSKKK